MNYSNVPRKRLLNAFDLDLEIRVRLIPVVY